jgi:hypothetical protein
MRQASKSADLNPINFAYFKKLFGLLLAEFFLGTRQFNLVGDVQLIFQNHLMPFCPQQPDWRPLLALYAIAPHF